MGFMKNMCLCIFVLIMKCKYVYVSYIVKQQMELNQSDSFESYSPKCVKWNLNLNKESDIVLYSLYIMYTFSRY